MVVRHVKLTTVIYSLLLLSSFVILNACKLKKDTNDGSGALSVREQSSLDEKLSRLLDEAIQAGRISELASNADYNSVFEATNSDAPITSVDDGQSTVLSLAGRGKKGQNWFQDVWADVQAKWVASHRSICKVLGSQIKAGGIMATRPYFFMGRSAEAGLGFKTALRGQDFVWDFYNMQFGAFDYQAENFAFGASAAAVHGYVGLGYGKRPDVNTAWSGYFKSGSFSAPLPFAKFFNATGTGFVGANKHPSTGNIVEDPSFVGASIALAFSIPQIPPLSVSTTLSTGLWTPNQSLNDDVFNRWKSARLPVSKYGRDSCNGKCIRIDSAKVDGPAYYRLRAINLAYSIPLLLVPPRTEALFPGFANILILALTTGVLRDTLNSSQACASQK